MAAFDVRIGEIIEKGLEGAGLSKDEVAALCRVDPYEREAALLRWAGWKLAQDASSGVAEIEAQIGLDSAHCPKNCRFCSFAACNNVRLDEFELTRREVVDYARAYEEEGANLILLMSTAHYRFEKLVEMVAAVRESVSPLLPVLVNADDLTLGQCLRLKEAGACGAYHSVRMREGEDTGIPVQRRLDTLDNLRAAGMSLSSNVEPVGPEHSPDEVAAAIMRCVGARPYAGGVGRRFNVPGTAICARGMLDDIQASTLVAVYRLAAGSGMRLAGRASSVLSAASGANHAWAEVGSNPRDGVRRTESGGVGDSLRALKRLFADAGWRVLEGPSRGWDAS